MGELRTEPWLTFGARDKLSEFVSERKGCRVLEFGCGGSTIWFSRNGCDVTTIEHGQGWVTKVLNHIAKKGYKKPRIIVKGLPYHQVCKKLKGKFDLILVDGRNRVKCAEVSAKLLKSNGMLMLDNSDRIRYADVYYTLRRWDGPHVTKQPAPDEYGSFSDTWETCWWFKR